MGTLSKSPSWVLKIQLLDPSVLPPWVGISRKPELTTQTWTRILWYSCSALLPSHHPPNRHIWVLESWNTLEEVGRHWKALSKREAQLTVLRVVKPLRSSLEIKPPVGHGVSCPWLWAWHLWGTDMFSPCSRHGRLFVKKILNWGSQGPHGSCPPWRAVHKPRIEGGEGCVPRWLGLMLVLLHWVLVPWSFQGLHDNETILHYYLDPKEGKQTQAT